MNRSDGKHPVASHIAVMEVNRIARPLLVLSIERFAIVIPVSLDSWVRVMPLSWRICSR